MKSKTAVFKEEYIRAEDGVIKNKGAALRLGLNWAKLGRAEFKGSDQTWIIKLNPTCSVSLPIFISSSSTPAPSGNIVGQPIPFRPAFRWLWERPQPKPSDLDSLVDVQVDNFRVLMGQIALGTAIIPHGTTAEGECDKEIKRNNHHHHHHLHQQFSNGRHDDDAAFNDFLSSLMDYTPTIPNEFAEHYLAKSGYHCPDVRLTRLVAVATQKFVAEVASDAFQQCKARQADNPVDLGERFAKAHDQEVAGNQKMEYRLHHHPP